MIRCRRTRTRSAVRSSGVWGLGAFLDFWAGKDAHGGEVAETARKMLSRGSRARGLQAGRLGVGSSSCRWGYRALRRVLNTAGARFL